MIPELARFANDCYHVLRAPTRSKASILRNLFLSNGTTMGFQVCGFNRRTTKNLYRETFVRQHYHFQSESATPLIMDCGANIGMASLYFKWLYPKSRVIAFEPDPTTHAMLIRNIKANGLDIETHNCALWDENLQLDFFVDDHQPGSPLMSAYSARTGGRRITVPAHRLSDFIDGTVDFIKIDVEGAENRIVQDLLDTKKIGVVRQMVIEYHHRIGNRKSDLSKFLALLEDAGFEYQIHGALYPVTSKNCFQDILIGAYR